MNEVNTRLRSIDILRGLIIIIMALDHTRTFFGATSFEPTDLSHTDLNWFFTRWITHFCAPLFVFLSGISAFLYGQKVNSKSELRNFLLSRGIWLIFLELTIVSFSWHLAYDFVAFQVIWVIGVSMIILAGCIYLSQKWILFISLTVIGLHNALNDEVIANSMGSISWIWSFLHHKEWLFFGEQKFGLFVLYPIIPWFAVMMIGYIAGNFYLKQKIERKKTFLLLGSALIILFIFLRLIIGYGDSQVWELNSEQHPMLSLLNTSKYPPSLQYLCMTLGPGLIVLAFLENVNTGRPLSTLFRWCENFGRVPMFFYLLHLPVINMGAVIYWNIRYGTVINTLQDSSTWPKEYEASLLLVFAAWISFLFLLYIPSKKFGLYKKNNKSVWLSYL